MGKNRRIVGRRDYVAVRILLITQYVVKEKVGD
jgi:hypothetical protein